MTKDCGCDKKPNGELNKIWEYIKGYEPKQIDNPLPSYSGRNGFIYQTNNGRYAIFYTFSIVNNDIIKYFITLSKIKEVKYNKNTKTTFLKCKKQFTHDFSVNPKIIEDTIDNISNDNYDTIPHSALQFNGVIIDNIKKVEKKEGLITKIVSVIQQHKGDSDLGCGGNCVGQTCGSDCPSCGFVSLTCKK